MYAFFTLHIALPLFVNSNFLTSFLSEKIVDATYITAAILAILAMSAVAKAIANFGNYHTLLVLLLLEISMVIVLAAASLPAVLVFAFICHWILTAVIKFNLDIFLEDFSKQAATAETRGTVITLNHIAFVLAPLIAGFLLGEAAYWKVYLASALAALPVVAILIKNFNHFHDPNYHQGSLLASIRSVEKNVNIRLILTDLLILRAFYGFMSIYTPIYLYRYAGLSFDQVGIILAIMLVPFIFLGKPLGWVADHWWGEKELLIVGFIITSLFTASLSFVSSESVLVWGGLLFGTRVGAACIQTMSSGYFFKQVETRDTDTMTILRILRPVGYIIVPAVAGAALFLVPFKYLFVIMAFFLIVGAIISLPLKDTTPKTVET
jgi:hypothetical protein